MTLPFVVRTVQPVLEELEKDVEEVVASLGATRLTTFRRIILPRVVTIGSLFLLVAWPVSLAVFINLVFGVGVSMLLVGYEFPGKRLLSVLIDVPLSVSPVVVGLALLVYNSRDGWLGKGMADNGIQVIFATPGMVMATVFVALPLVIREVVPVLEEIGVDQEQAARSLGANALQTFRRITLPSIKWAVVYGVVLGLARSLGEFGAVKIVSGNFAERTRIATLVVEQKYQNFEQSTAYDTSFMLAFASVVCIVTIPTGQLTALLGPSGWGKTTLLKIIAGLESSDEGTITIEGTAATHLPAQKRNVGFVFQHYAAFKHLSVAKNVAFSLKIRKRPRQEVERRVEELLELVHLEQFAHRLPAQLSGGQRQRMALARALAVEPKVLRDWLRRLHDEVHVTTVFVTHDQAEALGVADEIVVVNEGRIEQIGSPDQLYDAAANDFAMSFLGPVNKMNGQLIRPHDIEVVEHVGVLGPVAGVVSRMTRVGFEVRLTVSTEDQGDVNVVLTRATARAFDLDVGKIVWLAANRSACTVPVMRSVG